ncbi:MAG: hypothetical protein JXM70_24060 [Pirellulales bacterium]|nr:hypothetical protein [Pirellulales bacterium]
MGKRVDFGLNWYDFLEKWCSGVTPSVPCEEGWRALGIIERLFPEHLDKVLAGGLKGIAFIAPMIDFGITLEACENLVGFDRLLSRMKKEEGAAFSEAEFAAALVKLGYNPILEPQLGKKCLDALISVGSEKVYFEIITPNTCDVMKTAYSEMQSLTQRIMKENTGMDVNIKLLTDLNPSISDSILAYLKTLSPSTENTHKMPDVALIKYSTFAPQALSFEHKQNDVELPELFVAGFNRTENGIKTRTNVGVSITDERAQSLMRAEADHFSNEEINILVMDISRVPAGIRCWSPLIQRRFQPNINRRFSAVVLLSSCIEATGISRHCSVLQNQYAYKKTPKCLLDNLGKLDRL